MNRLSILFIVLVFFSCSKLTKNNIEVYFFEQHDFTHIVRLDSTDIFKLSGLKKVMINNEDIYFLLKKEIEKNSQKLKNSYYPDVRYMIKIPEGIFYLDYSGNYITQKRYTGKIDFIETIESIVRQNESKSILISDPMPVFEENIEE